MAPLTKTEKEIRHALLDIGLKYCPSCSKCLDVSCFSASNQTLDKLQSYCKACYAEFYYSNRTKRLEWQSIYAASRKDETQQRNKSYYLKNKDRLCENERAAYHENREEKRSQNKAYLSTSRGKHARAVSNHRRKERERSSIPELTTAQWEYAIQYFGGACAYCGKQTNELHQDHFIPVSKGGRLIAKNIIPACPRCNLSKKDALPEDWISGRGKQFISPLSVERIYQYFATYE